MAHSFAEPIVVAPFTVVVDTREQARYDFDAIPTRGGGVTVVKTVRRTLKTGDYSIEGWEDCVAVERKSLTDLYGTLGRGRSRFEREAARMAEMEYVAIVIEAGWRDILQPWACNPIWFSTLSPRSVEGTILAWDQRYPNISWFSLDTRSQAERTTF